MRKNKIINIVYKSFIIFINFLRELNDYFYIKIKYELLWFFLFKIFVMSNGKN